MAAESNRQSTLVAALLERCPFPHPVSNISLIETHISWVILTGSFAYKIKKAIRLDFLDFSTLQSRRHYCREELRLNQQWAPELYLEVVPICGSYERPVIGGGGNVIEYAVKMVQFPQRSQLDNQLDAGLLQEDDMRDLAETIAGFHDIAKPLNFTTPEDSIQRVCAPMRDNFPPMQQITAIDTLSRVQNWTEKSLLDLEHVLIQRHRDGFVRECHADLHLANLVRLHSGIVAFDCVEFDPGLRNIDIISDVAFLVMDLVARARQDLAAVLLNRYLECTGDYAGMTVFGLYFVYHCMIRAKVAAIRGSERSEATSRGQDIYDLKHNLAVAFRWIDRRQPKLIAMHGYSGSGKTWVSSLLMSNLPAIRVRSDLERRRLPGATSTTSNSARPGQGIYTEQSRTRVYEHLIENADELLKAGFNVIIDASFLQRSNRQLLTALAERRNVVLVLVDTTARNTELVRRLRNRKASGLDVSEASAEVLDYQYETADALSSEERSLTISVATDVDINPGHVLRAIRRRKNS